MQAPEPQSPFLSRTMECQQTVPPLNAHRWLVMSEVSPSTLPLMPPVCQVPK